MSKRIVVTGMGAVSPLGCGVEPIWQRLLAGQSGIATLPAELIGDLPISIGGQVPDRARDPQAGFDPDLLLAAKEQRKMDRFILFALAAAQEALAQAGWAPQSAEAQERTATVIASGVGGFHAIAEAVRTTDGKGPRRLSPFTIPSFLCNMAAAHVSIRHGFKGPLGAPVTACAAGVQAIGDAARMIRAERSTWRSAAARKRPSTGSAWPASPPRAPCPAISTTAPSAPRAPSTRPATASSWAKAPAYWSSRNWSTPWRAAPGPSPSWWATAPAPTPTT